LSLHLNVYVKIKGETLNTGHNFEKNDTISFS